MIRLTIDNLTKKATICYNIYTEYENNVIYEMVSYFIPERDNFINLIVIENRKETKIKLPIHNTIVIIKE